MKRNSKAAGISLVALVITIIVLIILTGAVIVTFMEGGIIDRAKESVFKNDIRTYQEILALKRAENQMEIALGEKEDVEINASTLAEIQEIIPEFKEEYEGIIVVVDGEIMLAERYEDIATDMQKEWIKDLGLIKEPWDNSQEGLFIVETDGENKVITEYLGEGGDVIIPEGVTAIGDWVFFNATNVTSIKLPDTVKSFGHSAFEGTNITSINIPKGITTISDHAFAACSKLEKVNIPNTVTRIETMAFKNCDSLTSINLPSSIEYMGEDVFFQCTNLTTVNLEEGIKTVGGFRECSSLTSINIPNGVVSINNNAFECSGLTSITLPNSVTSIGHHAFFQCTNLTSITIPEGVTVIDDATFANCTNLTTINLPNSIKTIGMEAFQSSGLTSITLPNSLNYIGTYAFANCNLATVKIPSLSEVGMAIFDSVSSSAKFYVGNETIKTILLDESKFSGVTAAQITVGNL